MVHGGTRLRSSAVVCSSCCTKIITCMYKGICNIQGLQKKGAAGDMQPPRQRWCRLEVCCRSAGEKLQAGPSGLYTDSCRLEGGRDGTGVGGKY